MTLISLKFLFFFLAVCLVYFVLPARAQWVWLLIASLGFYWSVSHYTVFGTIYFLVMVLVNWGGARFMTDEKKGKIVYRSVLIFDIASIVILKYSEFLCKILLSMDWFKTDYTYDLCLHIIYYTKENCPPRISYFALIIIAYITDVYWGKSKAENNPGKALLFFSYFPIMTSGPIINFEQMKDQLWGEKHSFSYDRCIRGLERVLWGLFKKMVISERLAVVVSRIYDHYEVYSGLYIFVAAAMFVFQLYTDFSGLMDIVLGCSEILGINLPENFNTPFYSRNLSEFWRRWHITLGAFLRDYVLYPVQRSSVFIKMRKWCKTHMGKGYDKKFNFPLYLTLLISWFLIGLWHGGGWNYIFGVGIYMWAVIVIGELLAPVFACLIKALHINTECESYVWLLRIRTFVLFMFGLSFFRANTLKDGFLMWRSAFRRFNPWIFFDESLYKLGLDRREWGILIFGMILLFIVSFASQKTDVRDFIRRQNFIVRFVMFMFLFIMITVYGYYGTQFNAADFIYGRF